VSFFGFLLAVLPGDVDAFALVDGIGAFGAGALDGTVGFLVVSK